jgi:hypothetical protein
LFRIPIIQLQRKPMLKLNVGFTKKVGEANFGSRGAAVNLELEFDSSLAGDADRLRERIKQLFVMAKAAVDEELAGAKSTGPCGNGHSGDDKPHGQANGNGHAAGRRRDGTRPATASQVRALRAIAERQGIELGDKLHAMFGVRTVSELTIVVLPKTKQPVVDVHELPVERRRVERIKSIVTSVWRSIEAGLFYPTPSPLNCPSCPFRRPCRDWSG